MITWQQFITLIGSVIGALVGAASTYYLTRRRPKHLVCTELIRTSLLHIGQEAEAKTKVLYDQTEVEHLSLAKLQLRNTGSTEILKPEINISVEGPRRILEVRTELSDERYELEYDLREVRLRFDFVNAYSEHHEEVRLELICDGEIRAIDVAGSGAGWSARFETLAEHGQAQLVRMLTRPLWLILPLLMVVILRVSLVSQEFDRTSLTSGLVLGGVFTFSAFTAYWYVLWTWGRLKGPFLGQRERREDDKEFWDAFRSGGVVGCTRIVLYTLVALMAAGLAINMWLTGAP